MRRPSAPPAITYVPSLLAPALLGAAVLFAPGQAQAFKPPIQDGFDGGGYVFGAPPFLAGWDYIDDDDGYDDDGEITVQWGIHGGYMGGQPRGFKWSAGGAFEHTYLDHDSRFVDANQLRLLGEARLGGGNDWIFGYGLIGLGFGLTVWDYDCFGGNCGGFDDDETEPGFQLQFGGGVQFIVWKNLMVGGELDFDVGIYDCDFCADDDIAIFVGGLKALVGWYF